MVLAATWSGVGRPPDTWRSRCDAKTARTGHRAKSLPRYLRRGGADRQTPPGHDKLETTARYTRVATGLIVSVESPLEQLGKSRKKRSTAEPATSRRFMARPALEIADIFHRHGAAWREANRGHVSLGQLKVMSAIERCRTKGAP
jgi:hypothetical protein